MFQNVFLKYLYKFSIIKVISTITLVATTMLNLKALLIPPKIIFKDFHFDNYFAYSKKVLIKEEGWNYWRLTKFKIKKTSKFWNC